MTSDVFNMSSMNLTDNHTNSYPLWYFLNDSLMIIGNIIGIFVGFLFLFTTYRLDHPYYSISSLIACNTCFTISLTNIMLLLNAIYALKSDFRGIGSNDSFCKLRGTLLKLFHFSMYLSLCLKAFNRLRCIVYNRNPILTSYRYLILIISIQWLISILLTLIIRLNNGIDYDWGSHLCLIPIYHTFQFILMMSIYYISVIFISGIYIYILYYVLHLPLIERYRRKHQVALLRRILVLLIMIIIPGLVSTYLLIHWSLFGTIPLYSFKIRNLLDTIGHTGAVLTIFISHTKIRRQYYINKKIQQKSIMKKIHLENCEFILLREQIHTKNKIVFI